jgi:glycosyltransferase involved in cell wall biosynthesis
MKIVFLQDDFPPQSLGGAGFSTYELAHGLKKKGHEVYVITTCRKESESGGGKVDGIEVIRILSNYHHKWRSYVSLFNLPATRKVEQILDKIKPDIVHINNVHFYLSYQCFKIAQKHSKGVIFTARDTMSINYGKLQTKLYLKENDSRVTLVDRLKESRKRFNPFRNFFIRRYLKKADKIFAVSKALQQALLRNGIKNVDVLHTGTDVAFWGATETEKNNFRNKMV